MSVYARDVNGRTHWDTRTHVCISQSRQLEGSGVGDLLYNTGCESGTATVAKKTPNKPRKDKTAGEGDRVYMSVCVFVKVLAV